MHNKPIVVVITLLLLSAACRKQERIAMEKKYFRNVADSTLYQVLTREPVIEKADMLSIMVWVRNETYKREFNLFNTGGTGAAETSPSSGGSSAQGYLVDNQGFIQFPYLGSIKAEKKTKKELATEIQTKLVAAFVNDTPIVSIRLLNYKITVLGEVNRQGVYNIPGEQVNIIEALGLAGDLTFYGRRENIMVIRNKDGKKESGRINLNDGRIFESPFFNLQQNDVVYVEADKKKVANQDLSTIRTISIMTGIVSTLAILLSAINSFN